MVNKYLFLWRRHNIAIPDGLCPHKARCQIVAYEVMAPDNFYFVLPHPKQKHGRTLKFSSSLKR